MNTSQLSILLSILAAITWGASYTFLKPLDNMSPYIIQLISSVLSVFLVLGVTLFVGFFNYGNIRDIFTVSDFTANNILLSLGYGVFGTLGCIFYISSIEQTKIPDHNGNTIPTIIPTVISSSYVLFNIFFNSILFKEYEKLNIAYGIPGIVLTVIGVVLLSISVE